MTQQFHLLFSPIKLGPVTIPNRIMFAPHGQALASQDNLPTERQVHYFAERAKGGVGLIVLGGSLVMKNCIGFPFRNLVSDERAIPGYRKIAQAIHDRGGKVFAQLSHQGRQADSRNSREPIWAPSAIPCPYGREMPKEMEKEDFDELIRHYVKGVINLQEAGFDGAEVYSAHGYLLSQFLSPHTNKRTDEYGGSLENRLRLHREIIAAIRKQVGKDFAIGFRINADDFTPGGLGTNELGEAAKVLAATGELCYMSVSGGTYCSMLMITPDLNFPLGIYVPLSAAIREVVDIPVVCVGRIVDPVHAEKILQDGQADMIAMTRALVCEPEWAKKAREGELDDIRQCVGCNQGCVARTSLGFSISCIQNPTVGNEKEWGMGTLKTASKKKQVMIVGGGPGGMEAARVAAMRGHEVTLYERDNELGGQFNILTKNVKSREEMGGIIRYLTSQIKKLGVKMNFGIEVDAELIDRERPDVVIIATGSTPSRTGFSPAKPDVDKLPGVNQANVTTYWEILKGGINAGDNVVIIDERSDDRCTGTAEFLAEKDKKIKIITRLPYVGMGLPPGSSGPEYERLFAKGVEFYPFTLVKAIEGSSLVIYNIYSKQEQRIERVDTVVLVGYSNPNNALYHALRGRVKELHAIGDCVAPRNCIDAIFDAYKIARTI